MALEDYRSSLVDDTCSNIFVCSVDISGFTEAQNGNSKEYYFVVDVLWSDQRTMTVKRTYRDFLSFRETLVQYVNADVSNSSLFYGIEIPKLEGLRLFSRYTRALAEERETELQNFIKTLAKSSPLILTAPLVVDFFEPRATDPVPYNNQPEKWETEDADMDVFSRKWVKQKS